MRRYLLIAAGWAFFSIGMIGVFVPLLPTTPFMILAATCFSKSSERLHRWLLSLKGVGPLVKDWEEHQIIRMRAKIMATTLICLLVSYPLFFKDLSLLQKSLVLAVITSVLAYIWSRPSEKSAESSEGKDDEPKTRKHGESFIQFVQRKDKAGKVYTPRKGAAGLYTHVDRER